MKAPAACESGRGIVSVERGHKSGPITRLIDPDLLGRSLKPFVFLDHLDAVVSANFGFGMHPHSGIATLTYHLRGDVNYQDSSGKKGLLRAQGVEWMVSGAGVWHQGRIAENGAIEGFQLWVALDPTLEEGDAHSMYIAPEDVAVNGNIRILLGEWKGKVSKIPPPAAIDLLHVSLEAGESWVYPAHELRQQAWAFAFSGQILVDEMPFSKRLVVFDSTARNIRISAREATQFIFAAAERHPYDLVVGAHSVHTSHAALERSEERIRELGASLGMPR
jgi:redox-sensitive bicupin YhaK (pirin superfamily)